MPGGHVTRTSESHESDSHDDPPQADSESHEPALGDSESHEPQPKRRKRQRR